MLCALLLAACGSPASPPVPPPDIKPHGYFRMDTASFAIRSGGRTFALYNYNDASNITLKLDSATQTFEGIGRLILTYTDTLTDGGPDTTWVSRQICFLCDWTLGYMIPVPLKGAVISSQSLMRLENHLEYPVKSSTAWLFEVVFTASPDSFYVDVPVQENGDYFRMRFVR